MILSWIDDSLLWVKSDGRLGLGTGNPMAKMQVNHKSTPERPSFLMLDSINGLGPSMRFQRVGLDSFFTFSAGFDGPPSKRGMILSWIDDSLLWVKSDGRLGLGTGNPLAKMQVNHRSTALEPAIRILDSANSGFSGIAFNRTGELHEFGIGAHKPGGGATGVGIRSDADFPFFLTQGGNLGLGTTNPTQRLDVQGNTNISGQLLFNGQAGQAGQVLKSNGAFAPPTWADPAPNDAFSFKAFSSNIMVSGGSTVTVNSTSEKYDIGNIHNPSTGITTISKDGNYLVTIRGGFTTNSTETGPFLLKVILEVLNNDNSVAESVEETAALPGGFGAHTSNVSLHTQLQLQTGQKLRVKLSNTRPTGGVNSRLDEFSGVLL